MPQVMAQITIMSLTPDPRSKKKPHVSQEKVKLRKVLVLGEKKHQTKTTN